MERNSAEPSDSAAIRSASASATTAVDGDDGDDGDGDGDGSAWAVRRVVRAATGGAGSVRTWDRLAERQLLESWEQPNGVVVLDPAIAIEHLVSMRNADLALLVRSDALTSVLVLIFEQLWTTSETLDVPEATAPATRDVFPLSACGLVRGEERPRRGAWSSVSFRSRRAASLG